MKQPVKAGDMCKVVNGVYRDKSSNLGKTVRVDSHRGEHTVLGIIWRCTGPGAENIEQFDGSISTFADFPASWLEKIEPDAPPLESRTIALEIT